MATHKFEVGARVHVASRGMATIKELCTAHDAACYLVTLDGRNALRHAAESEISPPLTVGERVKVALWSRDAERGGPVGLVVRVLDGLNALVSFGGRERLLSTATLERLPPASVDGCATPAELVAAARRARLKANGGDLAAARRAAVAEVWTCSIDGVDVADALDRR